MPRAIDVHISEYRITDNAPDSVRSGRKDPARSLHLESYAAFFSFPFLTRIDCDGNAPSRDDIAFLAA